MKNQKLQSWFAPSLLRLVFTLGIVVTFACSAHAGASKNFGAQWAWNNNFGNGGNSAINASFGNGTNPSITISYNFSTFNLYGYPACIRGWHYGFNPTGDTLFPMQMSQATSIPCTFSYSSSGTNMAGDFAYDMFLRFDNAKSTPQLEVMVWGGNASYPIGTQTGTNVLSAGGWTFDLWEGNNSAAGYYVYTFIPHGTAGSPSLPTSGSVNVDMKTFFNWLQTNRSSSGHYNNTMFLDVIEAGLEVTRGNGSASMTGNFSASTDGGGGGGGGPVPAGTYSLQNLADGKMLDNLGATADGATVAQWADGSSNNQRWVLSYVGTSARLTCVTGGKSLDNLAHTTDGSTVGQWTTNASSNQLWTLQSQGNGYYKIINVANGKCLDTGGATTDGGVMKFFTSGSSSNQQWRFVTP
jgi:hypothetical protein